TTLDTSLFGGVREQLSSIGVSPMTADGTSAVTHGREIKKRQGANLPHWEAKDGVYFVTFRLADSLPEEARKRIKFEREDIIATAIQLGRELSASELDRLTRLHTEKLDELLASGHGDCDLAREDCGEVVSNALRHFNGERYELFAWCVMPNHVHVVFRPIGDHKLENIMQSWKSFTSKACNKLTGKTGVFWQTESFDRLIRNQSEFEKFIQYTVDNPSKAGLETWKNVWRKDSSIGVPPMSLDSRTANQDHGQDAHATRQKRIADHLRAAVFCIADGVSPGKEKAEYIIRRIVRRAFRDGKALGFDGPFLHKLVPVLVEQYGEAYTSLKQNPAGLAGILEAEEKHFAQTLERGLQLLGAAIGRIVELGETSKPFSGKIAFDLYQSAGLPVDVVRDELAASEMTLDEAGYIKAEEDHIKASSAGGKGALFDKGWFNEVKSSAAITQFTGYENDSDTGEIVGIGIGDDLTDSIKAGDKATIVLNTTPFYAESGGQTGDTGRLVGENGLFEVFDTKKRDDYFLHIGKVIEGEIKSGEQVTANVNTAKRDATKANHSATHLMHAALRNVLGEHVLQKGSEVGPERLRFDFSHGQGVSFEERQKIERQVNDEIQANTEISTQVMKPEEAQKAGAMALFGEKYGDEVRVLSMGRDIGVSPMSVPDVPSGKQDMSKIEKRQGAYLPHWEAENATYFVTFRLADSLSKESRDKIVQEREEIYAKADQMGRELSESEHEKLLKLHTEKIDGWLANGYGECHFKNDSCAETVANALKHFDGDRYVLSAWCIMPNHVHVVFKPTQGNSLSDIIQSWKSFTAKACNKLLGRTGEFWMPESFDRVVRDRSEYTTFIEYTAENPTKAGLNNWKWVWQFEESDCTDLSGETPNTHIGQRPMTRYSVELCGGIHASRTGDIGLFKITHEVSSSAGVRRIEAVTGSAALEIIEDEAAILARLHAATKAQPGKLEAKIEGLIKEVKDLKSQAKKSGGGVDVKVIEAIRANAQTVGETKVYVHDVKNVEAADLLTISDALGQDSASSAILLGSSGKGRALLLLAFSKDLLGRGLHAGKIIGEIARLVGGGGGGKPQQAQAGGKNPDGMGEALKLGVQRIEEGLNS
ncbi:MAG: alanine--tRNA ligase-related protein, partial [Planctomycetota bacterium]